MSDNEKQQDEKALIKLEPLELSVFDNQSGDLENKYTIPHFDGLKQAEAPFLEGEEVDGVIDFTKSFVPEVKVSENAYRLAELKAAGFGMTFDNRTEGLSAEQIANKAKQINKKLDEIALLGVDARERVMGEIKFQQTTSQMNNRLLGTNAGRFDWEKASDANVKTINVSFQGLKLIGEKNNK